MAKAKYVLLLPKNFNDGTDVPDSVVDAMCDEIMEIADGWTMAGVVVGAYRMKDGSKKMDRSTVVWIGVDEARLEALRTLVGRFARRLGQETLYFERTGGTIEFIQPIPEEDGP